MPVEDAPDDDDVRQTYNFAPGSHGLVYRADVPDYGAGRRHNEGAEATEGGHTEGMNDEPSGLEDAKVTKYKLQAMKWGALPSHQFYEASLADQLTILLVGLVPFWTKRNPDYGSVLKTINARDDSLAKSGGMWNTMKQKKRCIVIAQGFYEWLKKNGGKEKIPHYVKRNDEQLMCFAGLWDCVQFEGSDEKHYTYTIITTDSNKQLSFLHDRMPVILENGSDQIRTWLDPSRAEWSKELQSLLKPFPGELECYPVDKAVGKVGNNSPAFIVPVASTENKNNIANFFSSAKKSAKGEEEKKEIKKEEPETKKMGGKVEHEKDEQRATKEQSSTEDNAPIPVSPAAPPKIGSKRSHEEDAADSTDQKTKVAKSDDSKAYQPTTVTPEKRAGRQSRSATSNGTQGSPAKAGDGSQRITNFFDK